jgi:Flp pilus assembly protein TadD
MRNTSLPRGLSFLLLTGIAAALGACNRIAPGGEAAPVLAAPAGAVVVPVAPDAAPTDLALARKHFAAGHYGLAELHFQRSVESPDATAEGWLGLAASYDQLRRYDLADRAYAKALSVGGRTVAYLNNHGYSRMNRKDYRAASQELSAALAQDPENAQIMANLAELDQRVRGPR